jgi:hypothetical protein
LFGSNAAPARTLAAPVSGAAQRLQIDERPGVLRSEIAYSYGFGFRIGRDKIAGLQQAHSAICEAMGAQCRIVRVSQATSDWDGYGEIKLQVAAIAAGSLAKALREPAKKLGGAMVSSVRDGEDLSDSLIDTAGKLQSRLVLRDKLTDLLRKHRGSVDELIRVRTY